MQKLTISLQVTEIPPIAKRKNHVMLLLKNTTGKYLLGHKKHYPDGMARMVGGGIEENEEPVAAAARELTEETQLHVAPESLIKLAEVDATLTDQHQNQARILTHIYAYTLADDQKIQPSDDIDDIIELDEKQLTQLVQLYSQLTTDLHPILKFSWYDYGQLYGFIHKVALEEIQKLRVS